VTRMRRFCIPLALIALSVPMSAAAAGSAPGRGRPDSTGARQASRSGHSTRPDAGAQGNQPATRTSIKHLVVIFGENVSYDHYFGTYPNATNPSGEPAFYPSPQTTTPNGLNGPLLTNNPNSANPSRLDRTQALSCDQNHGYTAEQKAFDMGAMDKFVQNTDVESCSAPDQTAPHLVMDYYDGNTVTGLWNYAQSFAMSDNSYSDTFGPSTPGAINVTAGNTYGALCGPATAVYATAQCAPAPGATSGTPGASQPQGTGTIYSDADPNYDICSATQDGRTAAGTTQMGAQNIGDLLNAAGVTWGSFMGGFNLSIVNPNGTTGCSRSSTGLAGTTNDYIPHHSFFNYYTSTSNGAHTRPASIAEIGNAGPANHQYDVEDFYAAVAESNFPAVNFIKAPAYQDGHAGYSDPLDEQTFVVNLINFLQTTPYWDSTAVVIMYDDSDGWYDHQMGPIVNTSTGVDDALTGPSACGTAATSLPGLNPADTHALGRCGYGPRLPLLVISPWARQNFVDHQVTDQSSIIHFIEDNWLSGQRIGNGSFDTIANSITQMFNFSTIRTNGTLFLNPSTGEK